MIPSEIPDCSRPAAANPSHQKMDEIEHPGMNDVICDAGEGENNHTGNIRFCKLVNGHKLRYLAATEIAKTMISREVVTKWRVLIPPGRFLKQKTSEDGKSGNWFDVGDEEARKIASQCLREQSTPDDALFIKKLEQAAALSKELLQMQQSAVEKAQAELKASECHVPPGSIGVAIDTKNGQPVIHQVRDDSPVAGILHHSDVIIGVDDVDTSSMTAADLAQLMMDRIDKRRKITFLRGETTKKKQVTFLEGETTKKKQVTFLEGETTKKKQVTFLDGETTKKKHVKAEKVVLIVGSLELDIRTALAKIKRIWVLFGSLTFWWLLLPSRRSKENRYETLVH